MQRTLPKVVQDTHNCLKWLIPKLDQFPRSRRFTLGERLENNLLEVLELLTEAAYSRNNRLQLQAANRKLASARHLWRLAYELKAVSHKGYSYGSGLLVEVGQQIGGWQRSQRSSSGERT